MKINRFEELKSWIEARELVKMVYGSINNSDIFKKDYRFVSQITSASVSSMSNIAEGFSRKSDKEFIQFLFIAKSSASEVQSLLYVASDLGYITKESFDMIYMQADKVAQIISGHIKYLSNSSKKQRNDSMTQRRNDNIDAMDARNSIDSMNSINARTQ